MRRIIHILGIQKSGTSLLTRLLENTGAAQFLDGKGKTEGGIPWGQKPSFSPTAFPAGTIYQRLGESHGHVIGAEDATEDVVAHIRDAVAAKLQSLPTSIGISKCPYSTVRIPWIRAIIPELYIVAIVRRPVANVFSLLKRHLDHSSRGPEEGWWGVKPLGWRDMVSSDLVDQIARQWSAVNLKLWKDRGLVDAFVTYDHLCSRPAHVIRAILAGVGQEGIPLEDVPTLRSCDGEFRSGSGLRPKRTYWAETNQLELPDNEPIEIPPLAAEKVTAVEKICADTAAKLRIDIK